MDIGLSIHINIYIYYKRIDIEKVTCSFYFIFLKEKLNIKLKKIQKKNFEVEKIMMVKWRDREHGVRGQVKLVSLKRFKAPKVHGMI